jgi:hypothetical protein
MTTKSTTKATKPATKPAVKSLPFDAKVLASSIGNLVAQNMTASAVINEECKVMHLALKKAKITVGTFKSDCVIMQAFLAPMIALGLAPRTQQNSATTFRKAVNEGKEYTANPYRSALKKKGAKTGNAKKDDAKTSGVTFKGDATIQDISKGLRVMFNKFKENDKTLALAGFLIDALDEFDENNK